MQHLFGVSYLLKAMYEGLMMKAKTSNLINGTIDDQSPNSNEAFKLY